MISLYIRRLPDAYHYAGGQTLERTMQTDSTYYVVVVLCTARASAHIQIPPKTTAQKISLSALVALSEVLTAACPRQCTSAEKSSLALDIMHPST